jgi:hypothetical protein
MKDEKGTSQQRVRRAISAEPFFILQDTNSCVILDEDKIVRFFCDFECVLVVGKATTVEECGDDLNVTCQMPTLLKPPIISAT